MSSFGSLRPEAPHLQPHLSELPGYKEAELGSLCSSSKLLHGAQALPEPKKTVGTNGTSLSHRPATRGPWMNGLCRSPAPAQRAEPWRRGQGGWGRGCLPHGGVSSQLHPPLLSISPNDTDGPVTSPASNMKLQHEGEPSQAVAQ